MVNFYYDLATDFYEYGWGESFHFGPRFIGEGFQESLRRAEYYLASRMELKEKMKVLDLGCGVGGPMRGIARFSGAKVTGVNNNDYQIKVGRKHNKTQSLESICEFVKADFMKLPFADNSYDAAYAIEATCHAPDRVACFAEILRVLKPGGYFSAYEWVMTKKYDPDNKQHRAVKEGIELGNGLPTLAIEHEIPVALKQAGFEVIEHFDRNAMMLDSNQIPWYQPLAGQYTLEGFRRTKPGRSFTTALVWVLETLRIAPKGTFKVQEILSATADDLVKSGELGVFTPTYYFLARKPRK